MDRTQDEELKAHLLKTDESFRELARQHAEYSKLVEEIEKKAHVTERDELEEHRLKKLKLNVKDQMNQIIDHYRSATVGS